MYESTKWRDRIVDAESGQLMQKGTDLSAGNFNNMENGITDAHVAAFLMMLNASNAGKNHLTVKKIGKAALPLPCIWSSVAYGNGKIVAVSNEIIAYSDDGITWGETAVNGTTVWNSVAYGEGAFVAVGNDTDNVAYSTDGINWTLKEHVLPEHADWLSVTYCDGGFVAVSFQKHIAIGSVDGDLWDLEDVSNPFAYSCVVSGEGKCVVLPQLDSKIAYSSEFGVEWTVTDAGCGGAVCAAYGKGLFVAVAYIYKYYTLYSWDGIHWQKMDAFPWGENNPSTSLPVCSVAYGKGKFVAVTQDTDVAIFSDDGINWTGTKLPASEKWSAVAYCKDKFVAVAKDSDIVAYSRDGIHWTTDYYIIERNGEDVTEQVRLALGV